MLFPIHQSIQCANGNCRHVYFVRTEDLIRAASRAVCPLCNLVTQYADRQAEQRGLSQETRNAWKAVSGIAATIGFFIFLGKAIDWANS